MSSFCGRSSVVERNVANVEVVGSSPIARSSFEVDPLDVLVYPQLVGRQEQINKIIDEWIAREPERYGLRSRLEKARMLVDNVRIAAPQPGGTVSYFIEGSQGRAYTVDVEPGGKMKCSCPDRDENWSLSHCKHMIAVQVYLEVPSPKPLDPRAFEQVIREWAKGPKPDAEYEGYDPSIDEPEVMQMHPWEGWLDDNGYFAIRMLLQEIDRLRAIVGVEGKEGGSP
jgi:hypothetical protein